MTTIIKKDIPKRNSNQSYNGGGNTTIIQGTPTPVIDNLNSKSSTSALSANQGRILNNIKLSKETDDTCKGYITFNKGLMSYGDIKAGGFNDNGDTGKGAALFQNNGKWNIISDKNIVRNSISTSDYDDINNKGAALYQNEAKTEWNAVVDNLRVRGKFNVTTLEVEHAKHIGGDIYLTKAGMVCNKVEKINSGTLTNPMVRYKCYFDNVGKDGLKIYNQFEAGDLAFCQTFNNNQVRKWWRAVHGVGENWILVDDIGCLEGSDIPQAGDHIVQLGNMTSVEETKDRQTAVILSTDSICLYRGINDFVLPEPYIRLDPRNTKIDAASIEFLGQVVANGNFVVDKEGNLTVQGKIIATSGTFTGTINASEGNIGNFTIKDGGLFNDTSTNERANITITDNLIPSNATRAFVVNPKDLAPEEKGAIVSVTHKVNEGDGIEAFTTNGNAIWGTTENGQALTGYATGFNGHGLVANKASINGLQLNVALINSDTATDMGLLTHTEEIDIIKITNGITKSVNIWLPYLTDTVGKKLIIVNKSNFVQYINMQQLGDGTFEKLEGTGGTVYNPTKDSYGNYYLRYELTKWKTLELLNTGDAWTILRVAP